jgi:hypothetical protein
LTLEMQFSVWDTNYTDDYNYILAVIDLFSRYAWAKPIKIKEGLEVRKAFEEIFLKEKPDKIQFDDSKEFYNKYF